MDIIQKKLTEFSGKTFSDHKSFSIELEKAFKAIQKETIKAMLVEEMPEKFAHAPLEGEFSDKLEYGDGFNQCCALQNKKGQEIKDKLK